MSDTFRKPEAVRRPWYARESAAVLKDYRRATRHIARQMLRTGRWDDVLVTHDRPKTEGRLTH